MIPVRIKPVFKKPGDMGSYYRGDFFYQVVAVRDPLGRLHTLV
jgi:hypothetical protein